MQVLRDDDVPGGIRDWPVESEESLGTAEKEVRLHGANDEDTLTVSTEIPTVIKWIFSVEESEINRVRVNEDGAVVACHTEIPKGIVKLQGTARKSNTHSQMVSYGSQRGDSE